MSQPTLISIEALERFKEHFDAVLGKRATAEQIHGLFVSIDGNALSMDAAQIADYVLDATNYEISEHALIIE